MAHQSSHNSTLREDFLFSKTTPASSKVPKWHLKKQTSLLSGVFMNIKTIIERMEHTMAIFSKHNRSHSCNNSADWCVSIDIAKRMWQNNQALLDKTEKDLKDTLITLERNQRIIAENQAQIEKNLAILKGITA